jgi:hypothetical protein
MHIAAVSSLAGFEGVGLDLSGDNVENVFLPKIVIFEEIIKICD